MGYNKGSNGLLARGCLKVPRAYDKVEQREIQTTSKLNVYNWLGDIIPPFTRESYNIVEVRFKNSRKDYFLKPDEMMLEAGDLVAVESNPGHDIGLVNLTGDLVRLQMKKCGHPTGNGQMKQVYRRARQADIDKWKATIDREEYTMLRARKIVESLKLEMKINDVEYQGDGTKAIFYYTAEGRVDFRQLIKDLAREFSIRVEMKQIGARQESARIGGISSCGRELCCATWLQNFRSVSTNVAREQQVSLNPQKLAGQCGKLKCCLNYEYDVYVDALKEFPNPNTVINTKKGKAFIQKKDIFKRIIWFSYEETPGIFHPLTLEKTLKIVEMNKKGQAPQSLEELMETSSSVAENDFASSDNEDDIHRFDKKPVKEGPGKRPQKGAKSRGKGQPPKVAKNKSRRPRGQHRSQQPKRKNEGPGPQKKQ